MIGTVILAAVISAALITSIVALIRHSQRTENDAGREMRVAESFARAEQIQRQSKELAGRAQATRAANHLVESVEELLRGKGPA